MESEPLRYAVVGNNTTDAGLHVDLEAQAPASPTREVKNSLCIDGTLNRAFDEIMGSHEPNEVFNLLTALAHTAVDRTASAVATFDNDKVPGFGLSLTQLEVLLQHGLKPEEIGGSADVQHSRVNELVHWFARLAEGRANGKWAVQHAFELAYYIASEGMNRHVDLNAFQKAAWLEGVHITASERGTLERLGVIKKEAQQ